MSKMQQRVVNLISKPAKQRSVPEIDILLPWFRKKSDLLRELEKDVIIDIVRNCECLQAAKDDVIIRQGDKGDRFYIILSGSVSVYIDAVKSGEEDMQSIASGPSQLSTRSEDIDKQIEKIKKKSLDRSQFGKYVIRFEAGKSFGEIALITDDSIRNASIIADERTIFLVIHRNLYNHTLKAYQKQEYADRQAFVENHPLFRNWSPRFKSLLEMSIIREKYIFDTPIIKQGDPVNGLTFIQSGRAKVLVERGRHAEQYPYMVPFIATNDVYELEFNRPQRRPKSIKRSKSPMKQEYISLKRREGYTAAEKRNFHRLITLCYVEPGEIFGDIETVMNMSTYMQTVVCTTETVVYRLTSKNYERLVTRRNPVTLDLLRYQVETKLASRAYTVQGDKVPVLRHLLFKLTQEEKYVQPKIPPLRGTKELPDREVLFNHLLGAFVQHKAELLEPAVPGAVYYREIMREKAQVRQTVKKARWQRERSKAKIRNKFLNRRPRTLMALRGALQKQQKEEEDKEQELFVKKIHQEEKLALVEDFNSLDHKLKQTMRSSIDNFSIGATLDPYKVKEKAIQKMQQVAKPEPKSDEIAIQAIADGNLPPNESDQTATNQPSEETNIANNTVDQTDDMIVNVNINELSNTHISANIESQNNTDRGIEHSVLNTAGSVNDLNCHSLAGEVSQPTKEAEDTKENDTQEKDGYVDDTHDISHYRPKIRAESIDGVFDDNESIISGRRDAESAGPVLVTETLNRHHVLPPIRDQTEISIALSSSTMSHQEPKPPKSRMRFVNAYVRYKLHGIDENPVYRDWETSDKTLSFLEDRIKKFHLKNDRTGDTKRAAATMVLPKLRRYEAGEDELQQPKQGGKVFVRKNLCPVRDIKHIVNNHSHTRFNMVPVIPNYGKLKRTKMLMHKFMDESIDKKLAKGHQSIV